MRLEVLGGANWRCAQCGLYANQVDHVTPLEAGGDPWDRDNLQALCGSCHRAKTAGENRLPAPEGAAEWAAAVAELTA